MLTVRAAHYLRETDPLVIAEEYGSFTTDKFRDGETAVVIPARQAEDKLSMLAATLLTLANTEAGGVRPYVVPNGPRSHEVAGLARRMGAITLDPPEIATKTAALQTGVEQAVGEDGHRNVLFVDSDALVWSRLWPAVMQRALTRHNPARPGIVAGLVAFDRGGTTQQFGLNTLRTVRKPVADLRRLRRNESPMMNGVNMGLRFDQDGVLYSLYRQMDPALSMRVDLAVQDLTTKHANGHSAIVWNLQSLVLSPGDRFSTFREYRQANRDAAVRAGMYSRSYGDIYPYDGTNLFSSDVADVNEKSPRLLP